MFFKKLKTENALLQELLKDKDAEIKKLRAKIAGERVCGGYCAVCKHSYQIPTMFASIPSYGCEIDCKCKDFSKKDV